MGIGAAGNLAYHIAGSGPDTVLVPLGVLLEVPLTPLTRSHTVVFYDPRGRGRSTSYADTTLSTFAADVGDIEQVRSALGISRLSLIGFSYLAAVAAEYAATHPDRVERLVLLSPVELTDSLAQLRDDREALARIDTVAARQLVKMRAAGRDTSDAEGYCRAYWALNAPVFVGDTAHASRLQPDFCALPNESIRALGDHMARVMGSLAGRRDFTPIAARVQAPTLVLRGGHDLVASAAGARAWAAAIPGARLLTLFGTGHMLYLDQPDAVNAALTFFLDGGWPPGAQVVR